MSEFRRLAEDVHAGGRACRFVVGKLCKGEIQGTYVKKYKSCIYCDFYKEVKEEEEYSGSLLLQPVSS